MLQIQITVALVDESIKGWVSVTGHFHVLKSDNELDICDT